MYTWWLMFFIFDLYLNIVDHIVGHLVIIIQVRFMNPLDPLNIIDFIIKKKEYRDWERKLNERIN